MRSFIILMISLLFATGAGYSQNIVKCQKQETLEASKSKLIKTYGEDNVNHALAGEIVEGMPEALLLEAFNTQSVKYDAEGCQAYNVFDDKILKRRRPNEVAPSPLFFVIVSEKKIVKIKPAEKNGRYKIKNGMVIY